MAIRQCMRSVMCEIRVCTALGYLAAAAVKKKSPRATYKQKRHTANPTQRSIGCIPPWACQAAHAVDLTVHAAACRGNCMEYQLPLPHYVKNTQAQHNSPHEFVSIPISPQMRLSK